MNTDWRKLPPFPSGYPSRFCNDNMKTRFPSKALGTQTVGNIGLGKVGDVREILTFWEKLGKLGDVRGKLGDVREISTFSWTSLANNRFESDVKRLTPFHVAQAG